MTTLSDLQDKWFKEDVALGQQQSAAELSAINGSSFDWLQFGASVLDSAMEPSAPTTSTSSTVINSNVDHSGWGVNLGDGAVLSNNRQQLPTLGGFGLAVLIAVATAFLLSQRKRRA
jgi:hypothetical protein